ncbi:hypothetical protein EXN66_Car010919 [Channa argus]|uniref:MABP domain-containing protein n=1 Tax=Channa argus TaxID=215402 RepID=A0A6G1PYH9_CHAAH|nr:hypothetical protein EXN66_Car010919 [Channa argus]KAK2901533.1 hypothetical protein Q8A73_011279 [Channa argus]
MSQYITQLQVSLNEDEENNLRKQGFIKISGDLNKGVGGKFIYLWYKKGQGAPITRIQFTFNDEMSQGLKAAGYQKIDRDLNSGAGGDFIFLWLYRGSSKYDVPIVDLQVSTEATEEAPKFNLGFERLACDLNRKAEGNWIYLWVKREKPTYICDVTATDNYASDAMNFQNAFIRVDEDTNRGAGGASVFIWYRVTTDPQQGLKDLKVSTSDEEYQGFKNQQYQSVNVNLNTGTGGSPVYLWYKKADCSIRSLSLITNMGAVELYDTSGVQVIKKNLNSGNKGATEYLCYYR